jgi:hypothetical protein
MRTAHRSRRSIPPRSAFAGFRFPAHVIVLAVRWYLRFGLSHRDVEELLTEQGSATPGTRPLTYFRQHNVLQRWPRRRRRASRRRRLDVEDDPGLALQDLPGADHGLPVAGATQRRPAHRRTPVHPPRRVQGRRPRRPARWPPAAAGGYRGPAVSQTGGQRRGRTAGSGRAGLAHAVVVLTGVG